MPSPGLYETAGTLEHLKKNSNLCKGPRETFPVEIEKDAKKYGQPGPGSYEHKMNYKVYGAFNLKDSKSSFIDEAKFLGEQSPHAYDANIDFVRERSPKTKLMPPKTKPGDNAIIEKNDKPSPMTYDDHISYKNT